MSSVVVARPTTKELGKKVQTSEVGRNSVRLITPCKGGNKDNSTIDYRHPFPLRGSPLYSQFLLLASLRRLMMRMKSQLTLIYCRGSLAYFAELSTNRSSLYALPTTSLVTSCVISPPCITAWVRITGMVRNARST
jgi:hypothetical protein